MKKTHFDDDTEEKHCTTMKYVKITVNDFYFIWSALLISISLVLIMFYLDINSHNEKTIYYRIISIESPLSFNNTDFYIDTTVPCYKDIIVLDNDEEKSLETSCLGNTTWIKINSIQNNKHLWAVYSDKKGAQP